MNILKKLSFVFTFCFIFTTNTFAQNNSFYQILKCSFIFCDNANTNSNLEIKQENRSFSFDFFKNIGFGNNIIVQNPNNVSLPTYKNPNFNNTAGNIDLKSNEIKSALIKTPILGNNILSQAEIQKKLNEFIINTDARNVDKNGNIISKYSDGNKDEVSAGEYKEPITAQEFYEQDQKTGIESPHYDTYEGGYSGSGSRAPAISSVVPDSEIKRSAESFDARNTFTGPVKAGCEGYGMDVGGSCPDKESYQNSFKFVTSRLCSLTGKRLSITSGNRSPSCNARVGGARGSSHVSGKAMDTAFTGYTNDEKTVVVLFFLAQGFNNAGGYGANKAMHMDMRNGVNRWGPNYSYTSCSSALFPDYSRKAFALIGLSPCDRTGAAVSKAKEALIKMGKQDFAVQAYNLTN